MAEKPYSSCDCFHEHRECRSSICNLRRAPRAEPFAPVRENEGPWFIRSHYWGAWHCRSESGRAAGYTRDITSAGIFDFAKAHAHHDALHGRNEAIPVLKVISLLEENLADLTSKRDEFAKNVEAVRAAVQRAKSGTEEGFGDAR